jgi:ABC-2 type transport system permease protein
MSKVLTIWRREMAACFLSPVSYVTFVAFLSVGGFTFWHLAVENTGQPEPLSVFLVESIVIWLPIMVTVVAMRLFVDEKRSGTIETLMTAPVTDAQVVLGKYLGAISFLVFVIAPAFLYVFVFERLSPTIHLGNMDLGALVGGAIILALITATLLAVAMVVSLLTRSQIISVICTFVAIWLVLLFGWLMGTIPGVDDELVEHLSFLKHAEQFARGSIVGGPIVLYVSLIALMLFIAVRVLESRHWR